MAHSIWMIVKPVALLYACRNRLGIRLQGPRPKFARPDGGEGGSHPSNVHDHVYAIGTINFTGKLPASIHSMLIMALCATNFALHTISNMLIVL